MTALAVAVSRGMCNAGHVTLQKDRVNRAEPAIEDLERKVQKLEKGKQQP